MFTNIHFHLTKHLSISTRKIRTVSISYERPCSVKPREDDVLSLRISVDDELDYNEVIWPHAHGANYTISYLLLQPTPITEQSHQRHHSRATLQ